MSLLRGSGLLGTAMGLLGCGAGGGEACCAGGSGEEPSRMEHVCTTWFKGQIGVTCSRGFGIKKGPQKITRKRSEAFSTTTAAVALHSLSASPAVSQNPSTAPGFPGVGVRPQREQRETTVLQGYIIQL